MIDRLIKLGLSERAFTALLVLAVIVVGFYSIFTLPTDSFPDVSNVQVQIITDPTSMATEEVEQLVTIPIEYALNGLPFIQQVRSSSEDSLSVVTAIFEDSCDVYLARQLVQQRLNTLTFAPGIPRPQLAPVVSSFSQVFMYYLKHEGTNNFIELRTLQDWVIAKKLLSVPGVGNVVSYGGWIKQYQVSVDHSKLRSYRMSLTEVTDAISRSNQNIGGNFIENGDEEVIIRGLGRVKTVDDLGNILLREVNGVPVFLNDVASIQIGPALRRGSASMNGEGEAVIGIVMARRGANTKDLVERVEKRLEEINAELPDGIKAVPFYNQKELVDKTMDTVREILFFSGGLVIVILTAILLDIPVALIVVVVIPLSLLFSFIMMKLTGLSSNLMTLGAVDFGVVVDAGVVVVENIYRRLSEAFEHAAEGETVDRLAVITAATREVGRPVTFAIMIIMAVYLPLFTLEGVEGKMFQPLALTFIYALAGALLMAITTLPVLSYWFLRGRVREKHNPVVERIKAAYIPILKACLSRPKIVTMFAVSVFLAVSPLVLLIGSEFIPSLDEGSLWLRMRFPASISHTKTIEWSGQIEKLIRGFKEVSVAVTRVGRSGMGSDVEGVDAADMFIGLRPKSEWQDRDKEHLVERMAKTASQMPGLMFSFSQPIADMVDDLVTGIKADVGIKIFGTDLHELDRLAAEVRSVVDKVPGTGETSREPLIGSPQLLIDIDRAKAARFGLLVGDVQDVIEAALAGKVVSEVIEGTRRFEVLVRFKEDQRDSANKIEQITVQTASGAQVPLKAVARISTHVGALFVQREGGQRRAGVMVNIRGRDLGSWVKDAQSKVAKEIRLPHGYRIEWGGQFENQQRAMKRLAMVVPVVLFLIFLLLYSTFSSVKNASLIMLNVPFATTGGLLALWLSHQPLSVPAIIGFIAVFGVAVQNGVILTSCIMQVQKSGKSLETSILEGASMRLRPILMTATVAMFGLLPKLFFDGTGAEIQRPLATVVFGGLFTSTVITLFVLPALYSVINRHNPDERKGGLQKVVDLFKIRRRPSDVVDASTK